MTTAQQRVSQDTWFAAFHAMEKDLAGSAPEWVHRIRKESLERFGELGFPTTRDEEWKYTNVAPIASTSFVPAIGGVTADDLASLNLDAFAGIRLVFVNGRYSRELSAPGTLPKGVRAGSLAEVLASGDGTLERHLARYADYRQQSFVALNTAFLRDGVFVEIPAGTVLEQPIYAIFITTAREQRPVVTHPRTLVIAGADSQASIVEAFFGIGTGLYLTNAVTEFIAADNAVLEHYKLQHDTDRAFHVSTVQFYQERHSNVVDHSVALGGALVRNDINVVLDASGAESTLNGLYIATREQHVDNHTLIDHAKPHCNSREFYKGILDGKAAGVFNGGILVRKDAQKTDAKQSNKNLLLSSDAVINTKPQLQIFADDVRCTHGATIGQIDEEAIFYLRSRGIDRKAARELLTFAFLNDVLMRMKVDPVRERVAGTVLEKLSETTAKG